MFAIPGISALVIFILVRPQEFFTLLERVPFLHLFTALAVVGWVIDIRLRRLQPIAAPSLPWVIALILWSLVTVAVKVPEQLIPRTIEMAILFAIYGTIAHGIQRFRTFQLVAGVLIGSCLFIATLCWIEGVSPKQCIGGLESEMAEDAVNAKPDGRPCDERQQCTVGPEVQPGYEYRCEHVGMFNMYSVEGRTRYIGELHDPNEVSLVISTGSLSLLIAFMLRKKQALERVMLAGMVVIVVWTVFLTQSRGGLVTAMLVPGVYMVRKWGIKAVIPAAAIAIPILMLGGRNDASADESTQLRYEAWAAGLEMFRGSPIFGVGLRQFAEHHFITAHNSYVLTLGEMGLPGLFLFVSVIYVSMKSVIVGLRELVGVPGSQVAQVWGMALCASLAGAIFQINTLSFAYHSALWIIFGMCGAWVSSIRHHKPDFTVKLEWRDIIIIGVMVVAYALVVLPIFVHRKGY